MQEGDEVARVNRIRNIIESMVFEKHEEIQDNKANLSNILSEEFKKKNYFKSLSREGSREPSREGSKERSREELKSEEAQSRKIEEEKNEEKNNKNPNIVVNLNSSRGRSPNRGTSRGESKGYNSQRSTFGRGNYYNPSKENLYDDDFGNQEEKGNTMSRSTQNIINTSGFASSSEYHLGFGETNFKTKNSSDEENEDSEEDNYKPLNTTLLNYNMNQDIKALIERLGGNRVPIPIPAFKGKVEEDPNEWLREYNNAAKAYGWTDTIKLESVIVYLKGSALDWFEDIQDQIVCWKNPENDDDKEFEVEFIKKFTTQERRNLWFNQFQ